jgi:hypothetical protein
MLDTIMHRAKAENVDVYKAYRAKYKDYYGDDFSLSDSHIEASMHKHDVKADANDISMRVIEDMCEEAHTN